MFQESISSQAGLEAPGRTRQGSLEACAMVGQRSDRGEGRGRKGGNSQGTMDPRMGTKRGKDP